ncbi:MAG: hypothetical protein JRC89_02385 [Deltaproteobacteria bacterium]|nr:hypothetical protein [Deltaproteobacteria bacterium]
MKTGGKKDLVTVINRSAEELHQKIDMHRCLMTTLLEKKVANETIKQLALPTYFPNENRLKQAIMETIDVLEESRKAFKSKRLEVLRKKLTQVLIEAK